MEPTKPSDVAELMAEMRSDLAEIREQLRKDLLVDLRNDMQVIMEELRNEMDEMNNELDELLKRSDDQGQRLDQLVLAYDEDRRAFDVALKEAMEEVRLEFAGELADANARIRDLETDIRARRFLGGTCRGECPIYSPAAYGY